MGFLRKYPRTAPIRSIIIISLFLFICLCFFQLHLPEIEKLQLMHPIFAISATEALLEDGPIRMEKIIHQAWTSTDIPPQFLRFVESWSKNHPDWTYMFWTDESVHQLISDKYPNLLPVFDMYSANIRRADAMRYVILLEYGGIYADLDMESIIPVNSVVTKYSCVLSQEPHEHQILDTKSEYLISNAFVACRSGHPFMKKLVENLPKFANMWHSTDSTGSHFLTFVYREYTNDIKYNASDNNIVIAPSDYFLPSLDPTKFSNMKYRCLNLFQNMSDIQKRACVTIHVKGFRRKPYAYSFTTHHWTYAYYFPMINVNIFNISPHAKVYTSKGSQNSLL